MELPAGLIERASRASPWTLPPRVLEQLATLLEELQPTATAETGCGASTLVFGHYSPNHAVFAFNEFDVFDKVRAPGVGFVEGPTQRTLPHHCFQTPLDAVLLDGPHAYPFPELEYFHFYPHVREGGTLVMDDIQIPTVHRLFDFVRRDAMWELETVVHRTAFLRRTSAPVFPPDADGWERQRFNERELWRYTWRDRLRRLLGR